MPKNQDIGPGEFHFSGFNKPNYTLVPDALFDELLAVLSGAELKVLLYIIRRTFGFKKDADTISLSQMLQGISTSDGRVLDKGTGLSKPTLLQALRSLQEKNIIYTERNRSVENGDEPTTYRLNVPSKGIEIPDNDTRGKKTLPGGVVKKSYSPVVKKHDTQDTVLQDTEFKNSNIRNVKTRKESYPEIGDNYEDKIAVTTQSRNPLLSGEGPEKLKEANNSRNDGSQSKPDFQQIGSVIAKGSYFKPEKEPTISTEEDREVIGAYIQDFAREFRDGATIRQSTSRAIHIFEQSGLSRQAFIDRLFKARAKTKENSDRIKKQDTQGTQAFPVKNKMPYFFSVVLDEVGLKGKEGNTK